MPQSGVTTNLLPPVEISLSQPPIPGDADNADCGIGLRHVEHPLVVYIDRPDATPPGTFFQLFWGSLTQPAAFNFLGEGDAGLTRIPFTVTQDRIQEFWADPVFARVIRDGGNLSETLPLRVRVNLQRPGGRDPDDKVPGHQGLVFELPPDVLLDGIDETRATQGVIATFRYWENMAAYDRITLAWGSQIITRWVQPDEVGNDIRIIVDPTTIALAGNSDVLPVAFQVMGPTGNYPDEWARWSAAQWVDVHADSDRLDPPWVKFPVTEREIDLEQLGGRDVIISTHVGRANASAYSVLTLIWAGTDRDGVSVPHTPSITIVAGSNRTYDFDIPHALVAAIAQGTVVVHYLLQGAGVPDKRSDNLHLEVKGESVKWPAPTIDEAIDEQLDPYLAEATVRFPFQESWPDEALLEVVFLAGGPDGTIEHRLGRQVNDIPPTGDGDMLFTVYTAELRRFDGYLTQVYYVLTRPNELPQESLRLEVQVAGTELVIEQTQMHLNGFSLKVPDWPKTGEDSINNTRTRTASGGVPPYQYSSSDTFIASVDSVTGKVTGNRNGSVIVTVSDSNAAELTYSVEVSNVWRLNINETLMTAPESIEWMESIGGTSIYDAIFYTVGYDVGRVYQPLPFREHFYWLCSIGWLPEHFAFLHRGQFYFGMARDQYLPAWCLTPL
ncbi:hypothetical protein AU074_03335 [Pseudomonas sp. ATCC PTA-122608]|uniref:Ig-like domain-containing protein n=1 Tax=Pseudomonas sp. ATCC PTA-122608 TaxID=1771311 RepID=UPI00096BB600|nr:Ig-like domain-containing protein [Pseudomonas sp. ATCC PTA-122608]OLY76816.1 hypothetical protein AU074_03335 [Pseudomonas sp. ATCC PTA-122608]